MHLMNLAQLQESIRDLNLTYLMLAQQMIKVDQSAAIYRLGLSQEMTALIGGLVPAQALKLANSNTLLCSFRFDENTLLSMVADYGKGRLMSQMHDAILMAAHSLKVVNEEAVCL